jgi:hypothetical protein
MKFDELVRPFLEADYRSKMIKIGIPPTLANYLHEISPDHAWWIANQIIRMPGFTEAKGEGGNLVAWFRELRPALTEILDWKANHPNIPLNKSITWEQAWRRANEWHLQLQTGSSIEAETQAPVGETYDDPEGTIIKEYDDGFYWIDLETNYSIPEKSCMVHCGKTDATTLYSLRHKTNTYNNNYRGDKFTGCRSYLTLAICPEQAQYRQCKGRSNQKPSEEYFKYVLDLFDDMDIRYYVREYDPQNDIRFKDLIQYAKQNPGACSEDYLDILLNYVEEGYSFDVVEGMARRLEEYVKGKEPPTKEVDLYIDISVDESVSFDERGDYTLHMNVSMPFNMDKSFVRYLGYGSAYNVWVKTIKPTIIDAFSDLLYIRKNQSVNDEINASANFEDIYFNYHQLEDDYNTVVEVIDNIYDTLNDLSVGAWDIVKEHITDYNDFETNNPFTQLLNLLYELDENGDVTVEGDSDDSDNMAVIRTHVYFPYGFPGVFRQKGVVPDRFLSDTVSRKIATPSVIFELLERIRKILLQDVFGPISFAHFYETSTKAIESSLEISYDKLTSPEAISKVIDDIRLMIEEIAPLKQKIDDIIERLGKTILRKNFLVEISHDMSDVVIHYTVKKRDKGPIPSLEWNSFPLIRLKDDHTPYADSEILHELKEDNYSGEVYIVAEPLKWFLNRIYMYDYYMGRTEKKYATTNHGLYEYIVDEITKYWPDKNNFKTIEGHVPDEWLENFIKTEWQKVQSQN